MKEKLNNNTTRSIDAFLYSHVRPYTGPADLHSCRSTTNSLIRRALVAHGGFGLLEPPKPLPVLCIAFAISSGAAVIPLFSFASANYPKRKNQRKGVFQKCFSSFYIHFVIAALRSREPSDPAQLCWPFGY